MRRNLSRGMRRRTLNGQPSANDDPWVTARQALAEPMRRRALGRSLQAAPEPPPQLRRSLAAGNIKAWITRWLLAAHITPGTDWVNLALHLRMAGLSREELIAALCVVAASDGEAPELLSDIFGSQAATCLATWIRRGCFELKKPEDGVASADGADAGSTPVFAAAP